MKTFEARQDFLQKCVPNLLLLPATKLRQGYVFTGVRNSVHRGACVAGGHVWQGGVHGRGRVWQGWGMCGRGQASQGGLHGGRHA